MASSSTAILGCVLFTNNCFIISIDDEFIPRKESLFCAKLIGTMRNTAVLLIDCPDRKGLVAAVASLLYRYGANITHADQHQDHEASLFFMRVEWALEGFDLSAFRTEF